MQPSIVIGSITGLYLRIDSQRQSIFLPFPRTERISSFFRAYAPSSKDEFGKKTALLGQFRASNIWAALWSGQIGVFRNCPGVAPSFSISKSV